MSATDPREEFYSNIDDYWSQLWTLNIGAKQPSKRIKDKFFVFVEGRCREVGDWSLRGDTLATLFSDFQDDLGDW
jgi:hypothetical protein|tara:strand:- start:392 stop:616 length:225 start_codon:yes stop_codon:yes gene_type:complete